MEQLLAPAMLDPAVEASLGRTIHVDVTRPIVVPCDRVPGPPGTPEHVARLLDLALALAAAAPHFAHRPALCGRIATEAHAVFTAARRYATPDDWSNSGEIEEAWARMLFETSARLEPHERAWVLDLVTLAATVTDDAPTRCGGNQRLRSLGREVRERLIAWQTDAGNRHAVDALRADSGRFW